VLGWQRRGPARQWDDGIVVETDAGRRPERSDRGGGRQPAFVRRGRRWLGAVRCWGSNANGQIGDGTTRPALRPVNVSGLDAPSATTAGFLHSCALVGGGAVRCWGQNVHGQLGNGSLTNVSVPVAVLAVSGASAVSAGSYHTCGLSSGSLRCWGSNLVGQLGNGSTADSPTAVAVSAP
jgi:alpha-tubulin suppressor-like RCC1 family protein